MDYIALKNEITTDPAGLGYVALSAAGDDQGIADALNLVRTGTAADGKSYSLFQGQVLDATRQNVRAIIVGIFSGMTATVSALTALASRNASRAEVLFGQGATVTTRDIALAFGRAN